jgi:hypothetical protein
MCRWNAFIQFCPCVLLFVNSMLWKYQTYVKHILQKNNDLILIKKKFNSVIFLRMQEIVLLTKISGNWQCFYLYFIFKQLRTCTTSLIPSFDFSTGIRRHTFKLPASGPREEGTVVNKSTASDIKLQFLQNNDVVQVLSCLNIKSPDRRGFQRRFNRLSDMMVDVNKQRMIDNQTYVKHIVNFFVVHCSTRGQNVCVAASQPGCGLLL